MRFGTRTFVWSLVPFALLLAGSFAAVQNRVLLKVREQVESSVKQAQASLAGMRLRAEQRDGRILRVVSQNPALKAGVQLLLGDPDDPQARRTVEDQLQEIGGELGFEFLLVSDGGGTPLAAVMLQEGRLAALDLSRQQPPQHGYFTNAGRTYQVTSVPIDAGGENLGALSVGEWLDLAALPGSAVLLRDSRILESNSRGLPLKEAEAALQRCGKDGECEIGLGGQTYISMSMQSGLQEEAGGYEIRSLENIDAATGPIQTILRRVFLFAGLGALAAAVLVSGWSSRSIVRPIAGVVGRLRESAETGKLPEFDGAGERIYEIRDLMETFNRAGAAIRDGQERLLHANVEFMESLANALDARDPYTAGHSRRVSQYACAVAQAMGLSTTEMQEIRVGALLHDIGKIGIADAILQKPGRLTEEEDRIIRQHPTIGRHILEGVDGFKPFLNVVELHHENWDGSGYPRGLKADQTPLAARVVKIADAWDAMTSDRPYRQGMSRNRALAVIRETAGTQMDPVIAEAFCTLWEPGRPAIETEAAEQPAAALLRLSKAVGSAVGLEVLTGQAGPANRSETREGLAEPALFQESSAVRSNSSEAPLPVNREEA